MSGSAIGRSQDIARTIVGIGVGRISRRFQQLALVVVGVGNGALPGSGEGCDVTHAVIGIAIFTAFGFIIPLYMDSSRVF